MSYRSISRDNEHSRGDRRDYKDYRSNRDNRRENYDRYNNGNNRRSRSRSRDRRRSSEKDLYNEIINQDNYEGNQSNSSYGGSNNRNYDRGGYDRKSRDRDGRDNRRNRDDRDYDYRKSQQHQQNHSNYNDDDYDSQSDPGENNAEQIPNSKIIVRGLAQHITEADIQCDLIQCNMKPTSIRLIRKKKTGQSRGFAFVEFQSTNEATEWLNMKNNVLILQNQYRALLQYSFVKDASKDMPIASDWYCGKCGVFNFKRRESCFKCQASKEESEKGGEGSDEVSNILTKKIMLRNLDALTNEEVVLCALQEAIPSLVSKVSKILICRDALTNTSRGICYLYFENLVDSMTTHGALKALETPLLIDSREVCISYCMDSENRAIVKNNQQQHSSNHYSQYNNKMTENPAYPSNYQYSLTDVNSLAEFSAGQFAAENTAEYDHYLKYYREYYTTLITQGQMGDQQAQTVSQSQHNAGSSYVGAQVAQSALERRTIKHNQRTREPELQPLPNGKDGKKYPTPDQSQFVYDETTGYYYDPTSRLYYHPTSQCFWNSEIGKYLYWDDDNKTFVLHVETKNAAAENKVSEQALVAPSPQSMSDEQKRNDKEYHPQDKVKSAKKIVKDMEKWAKQQNQRKDFGMITSVQRSEDSQSPPVQPAMRPLEATAADVGFSILEKKDRPAPTSTALSSFLPNNNSKLVSYGSDSDHEEEQQQVNESDYVDFEKLTCLICKRGFQTADILSKHLKMSNLHKENLQKYKLQKGVLDIGAGSSNLNYRDRAKERRLKYGEVDPPPVNKTRERFHREIEKQTTTTTYQANNVAQTPISQSNVGNKLLQKMGWVEGQGLGRSNQGRTEIIETESRVANAGLGSKHAAYGATGDDYKTYIKKMMKSRYEQN